MITTYILDEDKLKKMPFDPEKNPKAKLTWIDITRPTIEELKHIKKAYRIHPLVIEDCLSPDNTARIHEYTGHFFISLNTVTDLNNIRCTNINWIIGKQIIITTHNIKIRRFEELKENEEKLKKLLQEGQDFFLHHLLEKQNEDFFPAAEILESQLEKIEDDILKNTNKEIISKIFNLKKRMTHIKETTAKQKEVIFNLTNENPFISKRAQPYFRDMYDHISKVDTELERLRENILGVIEVNLIMNANKTNEIMKMLTIIATIMMPLTLIASIYGMNFKFMPEIQWKYGYIFSLLIMLILATIMIFYFKKRKWI